MQSSHSYCVLSYYRDNPIDLLSTAKIIFSSQNAISPNNIWVQEEKKK